MSLVDPKVIARLKSLPLNARQAKIGSVSGRHRSPHHGSSLEFAEYRQYTAGDDPRRLDWRAFARSDRYYIKEFEADTNLRLCLIVDTSGSMNYQSKLRSSSGPGNNHDDRAANQPLSKLEYGKRLAAALSYLASEQGDAVGLYTAGETFTQRINPKRGSSHLRIVLEQLELTTATGPTGLISCLHEAADQIRQRALVVVLSDLFVDTDELKSALGHLSFRKHEVAVFHLLDQQEIDFEFDRPTRFRDLESAEPVLADPVLIADQYREALQKYLAATSRVMQESGCVDYQRVSLNQHYGDVLSRFLLGRRNGGR